MKLFATGAKLADELRKGFSCECGYLVKSDDEVFSREGPIWMFDCPGCGSRYALVPVAGPN